MNIHDPQPGSEPKKFEFKTLNQEMIQDISDSILRDKKLETILALLYDVYGTGKGSEISEGSLNKAVELFLTTYPSLDFFQRKAIPKRSPETVLGKFSDIKEAMKAFKIIMYGENGNIIYTQQNT